MVTNVLLTGAFGRVGTAIIEHLADRQAYSFTYLDREEHPDHDAYVADIATDDLRPAFDGIDAVVHLAGDPSPSASWEDVLQNNVVGTQNVLDAASDAGVERVVFASTNHVVGMYPRDPGIDLADPDHGLLVDHEDPVRPDSYYAVSKLFGEHLGRYYVECADAPRRFYALRIGWVLEPEFDSPFGPAERAVAAGRYERGSPEYQRRIATGKAIWCSRRDVARIVHCALQDDSVSFGVFAARSGGARQWLDLDHAREVLGFEPADDADEWDQPLADDA